MTNRSKRWSVGLLFIPVALLAGIILGGIAPRRELEKAHTEIEWLKSQGGRRGGGSLNILTDVVRIPTESTPRNLDRPSPGPDEPTPETNDTAAGEPEETETLDAVVDETPPPPAPTGLAEQLEAAREAWEIRAEVARNSFLSRTALRENDAIQFDVVIAAMNLRLQASFEELATVLSAGEDLTTERGVRMVNDLTGVLALTYDELDRKLPDTWRATAGDDFDLTDFIDPSVAEPLIPVEHKLEDRPRRRGRP